MTRAEVWTDLAQDILDTGRHPHFAPSEAVLDIQRERIAAFRAQRGDGCRAIILGATPELADIALTAGCQVTRIDSSPAMFAAARKRQTVKDRRRETLLVGNWLHMGGIGDGEADIVLGDSSLNNVPHRDMARLLAELSRITRCDGMLVLRQIVLPDAPRPDFEFSAAVHAFRGATITDNEFHRILRFYSFNVGAYDTATRILDGRRVFAEIGQRHAEGALSDTEFEFLMGRYSEVRHTIYHHAEQQHLLESLGSCEAVSPEPAGAAHGLFMVFVIHRRPAQVHDA